MTATVVRGRVPRRGDVTDVAQTAAVLAGCAAIGAVVAGGLWLTGGGRTEALLAGVLVGLVATVAAVMVLFGRPPVVDPARWAPRDLTLTAPADLPEVGQVGQVGDIR